MDHDLQDEWESDQIELERLRDINAELLDALKAICAEGPKKPPHQYSSKALHRRWEIFQAARAVAIKAERA